MKKSPSDMKIVITQRFSEMTQRYTEVHRENMEDLSNNPINSLRTSVLLCESLCYNNCV